MEEKGSPGTKGMMELKGKMSAVNDRFGYHNRGVLGSWDNGCLDHFVPSWERSEALYLLVYTIYPMSSYFSFFSNGICTTYSN